MVCMCAALADDVSVSSVDLTLPVGAMPSYRWHISHLQCRLTVRTARIRARTLPAIPNHGCDPARIGLDSTGRGAARLSLAQFPSVDLTSCILDIVLDSIGRGAARLSSQAQFPSVDLTSQIIEKQVGGCTDCALRSRSLHSQPVVPQFSCF